MNRGRLVACIFIEASFCVFLSAFVLFYFYASSACSHKLFTFHAILVTCYFILLIRTLHPHVYFDSYI